MDIGEMNESGQEDSWEVSGWIDDEGYWWPDDSTWWTESDQGTQEEIDAVNKGKGKGVGPRCFNCGGYGRLARECKTKNRDNSAKGEENEAKEVKVRVTE